MKKIGILGGSFDPVHNGHLAIAKTVLEQKVVDEVWFMPNLKSKYKEQVASPEDRLRMLEIATRYMRNVKVSDLEIKRGTYSYTYDTAMALKNQKDKYYFIIGADSFYDLNNWYKSDELLDIANFIIVNRDALAFASLSKQANFYTFSRGGDYIAVKMDRVDVSSTIIRKNLAKGKSVKGMLPDTVIQYIMEKKLYR